MFYMLKLPPKNEVNVYVELKNEKLKASYGGAHL